MADDDANIPLHALANRRETGAAMALLVKGFKIGWRARQSEIDRLIRERDEARDLAFRAAFADADPFGDVLVRESTEAVRRLRGKWPNDPARDDLYGILDDIDARDVQ